MRHSHTSFTARPVSGAAHASGPLASVALGRSGMTLTRRGRLLLIGLPALTLLAAALVGLALLAGSFANMAQASSQEPAGVEAVEVTVAPGDTLWSVASELDSGEDVQVLIGQIAELNDLSSSELHPGQTLHVPVLD
ncbi:LysM peptidoglycan-binding domain-containing protein [Nesterenkonia sp. HG001]|uniref:LysM peptidoglycan-binding domain-containing protein n=1 Tax=Nesterenkonia sp. HG001 TaxID=2983207 RepID=UPI002AC7BCB3|nr:LysM peptidoglycan-binding domain-containing protein [Nesterenkonia sp. HG001]MDZ5076052.1 LysM peptidoglycan-binding domain-containing protein [Nesterenkonia sp. HG001]